MRLFYGGFAPGQLPPGLLPPGQLPPFIFGIIFILLVYEAHKQKPSKQGYV